MRTPLVIVVAAVASCWREPHPDLVQTSPTEHCLTCHLHDYQRTTMPVHAGTFPRTCDSCHYTESWEPALEGLHPAASRFEIDSGAHSGVACLACHDPARGPSTEGANATCTSCHTHRRSAVDGQHGGVDDYVWSDTDLRFCLDCHYLGGRD